MSSLSRRFKIVKTKIRLAATAITGETLPIKVLMEHGVLLGLQGKLRQAERSGLGFLNR
jgi:hypothetical protein